MSRSDRPLPAGAGGVRCIDCGATAAADGKGTPIVLNHAPDCPSRKDEVLRSAKALAARMLADEPTIVKTDRDQLVLEMGMAFGIEAAFQRADVPPRRRVQVMLHRSDGSEIEVCRGEAGEPSPYMFWHRVRPDGGELHLPPIFKVIPIPEN